MSREEVIKTLKASHKEEMEDYKKYMDLAKMLNESDMHSISNIIRDIAHDEESHIRVLAKIIEMEEEKL